MEYSLSQIASATGGVLENAGAALDHPLKIVTHSREAGPDTVFWALRGDAVDGHQFVEQVSQTGAACVVSQRWRGTTSGPLVRVPETLKALADLARWNRLRHPVRVIGITGSYGKTTTREMVHAVLNSGFHTCRSPKNFNNHIGLPLTLLGLKPQHEIAVVEMGASAIGEIRRLCEIALPDVGIITGIGHAHCGEFGGPEAVLKAKGELAEALPGRGLLLLPADDPACEALARRAACRVLRAGSGPRSCLQASSIRQEGPDLAVVIDGTAFRVPIIGRHFARSVLFAVLLGREFGLSDTEIADGLRHFSSVPGRCQIHSIGGMTIIDDCYNASPEAMKAAISLLSGWPASGRRVLVCGDMKELGRYSRELHEDTGLAAAAARLDHVLAFGAEAQAVVQGACQAGFDPDRAFAFANLDPLLDRLQSVLQPGDTVLIKGSRSMRMERIVDWLRTRRPESTPEPLARSK